jgi:hypothetical protein
VNTNKQVKPKRRSSKGKAMEGEEEVKIRVQKILSNRRNTPRSDREGKKQGRKGGLWLSR